MANSVVQVLKLDPGVHRTLKALTRAINRQTDVLIEIEQERRKSVEVVQYFSGTLVSGDEAEGLDEKLRKESGVDLDRKLMEEAVAEGDDPDTLNS